MGNHTTRPPQGPQIDAQQFRQENTNMPFPGKPPRETTATTQHTYIVEGNDPNNATIQCDYVQFTPTHVTFWDDEEPWDVLLLGVPLSPTATVRIADEGGDK
jgi:hypothetical protein